MTVDIMFVNDIVNEITQEILNEMPNAINKNLLLSIMKSFTVSAFHCDDSRFHFYLNSIYGSFWISGSSHEENIRDYIKVSMTSHICWLSSQYKIAGNNFHDICYKIYGEDWVKRQHYEEKNRCLDLKDVRKRLLEDLEHIEKQIVEFEKGDGDK